MEVGQDGRDGRGGHLYSHIHGQHYSEKGSGAKTPRTPSLREAAPNYNEIYASGRSSREKTPSARNASGERTPNIYEHRLVPSSGRSSTEKTPREIEGRAPLNEGNQIAERKRSSHKRERTNERRRAYDHDEGDERQTYNDRQIVVAHHGSRRPIQSSHRQQDSGRPISAPSRRNRLSKSTELYSQRKHGRIMDDEGSEEEDSASSLLRGQWDSTQPKMKTDMISSSQVSVVQRYVQNQAKALAKYNDSKENVIHDEWDSDLKKPKSTKTLTNQKAIAAVLAFQRWRHTQLKPYDEQLSLLHILKGVSVNKQNLAHLPAKFINLEKVHDKILLEEKLFSLELKNVLEEAKQDEACMAQLEKELAMKDKHMAQLRSQVAQYERESHEQVNQRQMHELLGANVQELEKECQKALERASLAEDVLRKRDAENVRLKERLRCLDEEGVRLDSELQASLKLLQNEKDSALDEGRILLAQLTRRDQEVAQQCKEIEKLRATIAQISNKQTAQQKQVDDIKAEHHAQVQNLEEKLQQAYAAKHSKEMELASYTERCNGLGEERQNLLVQLHRAVERADLASRRAEELQMKLHYTTEERAKASEDVAAEMAEHLNRLTGHMKELETSVDQNGLICWQPGALQKKAGLAKISTKLAQAELDTLNLICQANNCENDHGRHVPFPEVEENRRQVCFSLDRKSRRRSERSSSAITPFRQDAVDPLDMSLIDRDIALTKLKNWTAWKWRWAAAAARADSLLKQIQNQEHTLGKSKFLNEIEGGIVQSGSSPSRSQTMGLVKKLESSQFVDLNVLDGERVGAFILKHKLVPLIMSAWRAFAKMSGLERKAASRNESLNKIISALPWWIRRVGERRLMERFFFHWQLLTLKANREKSTPNYRRKIVPYVNTGYQSRVTDREADPSLAQVQAPAQISNSRTQTPTRVRDVESMERDEISDQEMSTSQMPCAERADSHVCLRQSQAKVVGASRSPALETDGKYRPPSQGAVEEDRRYRSPTHRAMEVDGKYRPATQGVLEVETKHRTPNPVRAANTPRTPLRAKPEQKTTSPCPTCDIRRKYSSRSLQQHLPTNINVHPNERRDPKYGSVNNSTFTARALGALQGSLQQELKELQYLLSQEMEDMQKMPVSAEELEEGGNGAGINRQALKSVFEVCNNLAQALMDVRSQLNCVENQGVNTPRRSKSPPPTLPTPRVLRTRYLDARDTSEGGGGRGLGSSAVSREKSSLGRGPNSGEVKTPRYASPIGRGKQGARFSSPGWRSQEKSAMTTTEPWNRPGSPPLRPSQLREREGRLRAPSTIRELREFRARKDRQQQQQVYENSYPRSGRQTPEDRDGDIGESRREEQQRQGRRGENVVRFSGEEPKAVERNDHYEDQQAMSTPISSSKLPPPPDYTTVVQILNQENTKIGEVAIHTSAVATTVDRTGSTDRGGIADLCSSARDAIRAEEQNNKTLTQPETQQQEQQQPRKPQQLAEPESMTYKSSESTYRPKSTLKLPARGKSAPRERTRSSHHVLRRPVDLTSRLDDTYFLSLRSKQCIGSDYADLLKSEIQRLREGRLMLEDCTTVGQQGLEEDSTGLSREMSPPRSSFLANRPSWRPHYTPPTTSSKK